MKEVKTGFQNLKANEYNSLTHSFRALYWIRTSDLLPVKQNQGFICVCTYLHILLIIR